MSDQDDIDASLSALGKRTEAIRPRANFTMDVMSAIANDSVPIPNLWGDLPGVARKLLPIFALAAAVSVAFGIHGSNVFDDAAAQYDETGIEW